jgi:hypothetical protein
MNEDYREDKPFTAAGFLGQVRGGKLGDGHQQIGNTRQQAYLEGGCLQGKGKGGDIVLGKAGHGRKGRTIERGRFQAFFNPTPWLRYGHIQFFACAVSLASA